MITTDKEAYQYVYDKLMIQYEMSVDEDETCRYRGYKKATINYWEKKALEIAVESNPMFDPDNDSFQFELRDLLCNVPYDAKCAAGHLIDDAFYDSSIEGQGVDEYVIEQIASSNPNWKITDTSAEMIKHMQNIHDRNDPSRWNELFFASLLNFDSDGEWLINNG